MTRPSDLRLDKGGSLGRKSSGGGGSAHGYNPNRAGDGRFGSGPRKARPKVGRPAATADGVARAPHPHVLAARAAVNKAKTAPTPKNIGEAKAAVARARGVKQNGAGKKSSKLKSGGDELTATGHGGTDRAKTPNHGVDRIKKAEASEPTRRGELIDAIGDSGIRSEGGRLTGLTYEAQRTVRGHYDDLAERHGMPRKFDQTEGHVLLTRTNEEMGGANGSRYRNGRIEIRSEIMAYLGYHAQDMAFDPKSVRPEGINAYQVMMHETVHSHGPYMPLDRNNTARHQLAEEMSTEMAARHITDSIHGLSPAEHEYTGYGDIMRTAAYHVASVNQTHLEDAHDALSRASLDFKRRNDLISPDDALRYIAERAVHHASSRSGSEDTSIAGRAQKTAAVDALHEKFRDLADEINKRYPWP